MEIGRLQGLPDMLRGGRQLFERRLLQPDYKLVTLAPRNEARGKPFGNERGEEFAEGLEQTVSSSGSQLLVHLVQPVQRNQHRRRGARPRDKLLGEKDLQVQLAQQSRARIAMQVLVELAQFVFALEQSREQVQSLIALHVCKPQQLMQIGDKPPTGGSPFSAEIQGV